MTISRIPVRAPAEPPLCHRRRPSRGRMLAHVDGIGDCPRSKKMAVALGVGGVSRPRPGSHRRRGHRERELRETEQLVAKRP